MLIEKSCLLLVTSQVLKHQQNPLNSISNDSLSVNMTTILHTGVVKQGKFVLFALAVSLVPKYYIYILCLVRNITGNDHVVPTGSNNYITKRHWCATLL